MRNVPSNTAFIVVDVQNDFCPGGKLAVNEGDRIVPLVNEVAKGFKTRIYTQDWHPEGHKSFASSHEGAAAFSVIEVPYPQVLWPDHCVQGTEGAQFRSDLAITAGDRILRKGTNSEIDSYSGFFENDGKTQPRFSDGSTLTDYLKSLGVTKVVLAGLAYDYCVGWHALDARKEGFDVTVLKDLTRSIAPDSETVMDRKLNTAGVRVTRYGDFFHGLSPAAPKNNSL